MVLPFLIITYSFLILTVYPVIFYSNDFSLHFLEFNSFFINFPDIFSNSTTFLDFFLKYNGYPVIFSIIMVWSIFSVNLLRAFIKNNLSVVKEWYDIIFPEIFVKTFLNACDFYYPHMLIYLKEILLAEWGYKLWDCKKLVILDRNFNLTLLELLHYNKEVNTECKLHCIFCFYI